MSSYIVIGTRIACQDSTTSQTGKNPEAEIFVEIWGSSFNVEKNCRWQKSVLQAVYTMWMPAHVWETMSMPRKWNLLRKVLWVCCIIILQQLGELCKKFCDGSILGKSFLARFTKIFLETQLMVNKSQNLFDFVRHTNNYQKSSFIGNS